MSPIALTQVAATGLSVLVGAVLVLSESSMLGPGRGPRCPTCNGSGRTTCACMRWSDDGSGCRSCAGSGRTACSSCGGDGTGRPVPVRVSASGPKQPS